MEPTIGRVVHYVISAADAERVNKRRSDAVRFPNPETGQVIHVGNQVSEGDVFPGTVVRVWPTTINLQVTLDGNDSLWATSVREGSGSGTWSWPPRV